MNRAWIGISGRRAPSFGSKGVELLQKPFTARALEEKLRDMLEGN